jgi:hypothetical protein
MTEQPDLRTRIRDAVRADGRSDFLDPEDIDDITDNVMAVLEDEELIAPARPTRRVFKPITSGPIVEFTYDPTPESERRYPTPEELVGSPIYDRTGKVVGRVGEIIERKSDFLTTFKIDPTEEKPDA